MDNLEKIGLIKRKASTQQTWSRARANEYEYCKILKTVDNMYVSEEEETATYKIINFFTIFTAIS